MQFPEYVDEFVGATQGYLDSFNHKLEHVEDPEEARARKFQGKLGTDIVTVLIHHGK